MILVEVRPRFDNKYDIYVSKNGEPLMNSNQGYENVEDAERIVRECFETDPPDMPDEPEPVTLRVKYRDGKTKTEQIR